MQYLLELVDRTFGRRSRHASDAPAVLTVKAIRARLADEDGTAEKLAAYPASVARQAAVTAAMDAPTLTLPVIYDAEIVDPPTMPLRRAELLELAEAEQWRAEGSRASELTNWERELLELVAPECDGGRPMHELDFALGAGGAA